MTLLLMVKLIVVPFLTSPPPPPLEKKYRDQDRQDDDHGDRRHRYYHHELKDLLKVALVSTCWNQIISRATTYENRAPGTIITVLHMSESIARKRRKL